MPNETLNFTRAVERCNVAQPSLTRAIKKLEDEFGGQLFRRERNLTHCTDLGRLMRPHLTAVFEASEGATNQAKDFSVLEKATLNLGVMRTIGPARLIAIIGVPNIPERFDTRTLYSERYVVAFSQGHRFEQMNAVPLGELDQEDYLARINCEYTEHFNERGVPKAHKVNVRYQSERESWVQALILAGMGCAIMPEFLPMLPGIATRVLIEPEIERDIQLVTVGGRRYSPPVQSFIRLAHRYDWSSSL